MSFENYKSIYSPSNDVVIRHGESASFTFNCTEDEIKQKAHRLFFTGETTLFYFWKGEYDCVPEYCNIEDALDNKRAKIAPYCLDLTNKEPVTYPKIVFKKTVFPPMLSYLKLHSYGDKWKAGIYAKTEDLTFVKPDARVRVVFEIRFSRDGLPLYATTYEPDEIYKFDIPVGTYDWTEYGMELNLPKDKMANVVCYIEAEGYTGTLLLERPYLVSSNNFNVLPDFQPPYLAHDKGSWIGHNISRKEWPEFEIRLNGNVIFDGEMFERCHKYSECTCTIPKNTLVVGENVLDIKLTSSYPNPIPYAIHEIGCFISDNNKVNVIACPEVVQANGKAAILIKTTEDNVDIELETDNKFISASKQHFEHAGYDVFVINTSVPANNVEFALISGDFRINAKIERIVEHLQDNVTTGTGDMVYINQEKMEDFAEFISWYFSNNIGNLLTIRPTYRWSGARVLNPEAWNFVTEILNKLGVKYVHMTDGREFPGACSNPTTEMLSGDGFMGRQSHEYDGAFSYWGHDEITGIYEAVGDYWMKLKRENRKTVNPRSTYAIDPNDGKLYPYVDPYNIPDSVEDATNLFIENFKSTHWDHTRHTGPSVLFKYIIQSGYEWSGAELLYGPLEMISAFMRGTAYCYDKPTIGGHLAIQWSTTPHDTPDRFRRYRASLYSSYLQGLHDINTEEGLWHLEEYYSAFNRKSAACLGHMKQQQDFYRYVATHSRTGEFYTDFAFIHGRYDGFRSFGKNAIYASAYFNTEAPELSWELLNIFYPLEVASGEIYLHPCPNDKEIGMLTGTPRGNVDVVPIETNADKLSKYKVLSFLGYNKALKDDMDKLMYFVSNGGKLIIGLPHIITTVNRYDIVDYKHEYIVHELTKIFADTFDFVQDSYKGEKINVNRLVNVKNAKVLEKTDNDVPLLIEYNLGSGNIYFVNAKEYPAEKGIEPIYRFIIEKLSDEVNSKEISFIECDDTVQFGIYEQCDSSRHIYLLAVDWYNSPDTIRRAKLVLGAKKYPIDINFGEMLKIVVKDNVAAWTCNDSADVLEVGNGFIKLQGIGTVKLCVVKNGNLFEQTVDFSDNAIKTVNL